MKASQRGLADKTIFLIIFCVALAAGLGLWLGQRFFSAKMPEMRQQNRPFASILLYPGAKEIAPFELRYSTGEKFDLAALRGKNTLIVFGFTTCPDVCPTTLSGVKASLAQLAPNVRPQVLMVSIDPARDLPQKLGDYVHFFSPEFKAATGSVEQLTPFAANLGAVFEKAPAEPGQSAASYAANYMMSHTSSIFLIGTDAKLHAIIRQPFDWRQIGYDLSVYFKEKQQ
jgi:protein SCO1